MSCESCLATGVVAARTCWVGDAELTRVQEEGIGVCNVELFFLFQQALPLARQGLKQSLSQGGGHLFVLFGSQVQAVVALIFESFEALVVVVLVRSQ